MQTNRAKAPDRFTHEGAPAKRINPEQQLRRSVLSCLLWEREFYEDGLTVADRIHEAAKHVDAKTVSELAIEARSQFNLRHAPLWLTVALIEKRESLYTASTIEQVIQRADELSELVSMYWKNGKRPLSAQMKKGIARAFRKFDAYRLAKYDRAKEVRLRDVMFLVHPKPKDDEQAAVWKALAEGTLESPDTWEVGLSTGGDKREVFTRLLKEEKLGYLALLRNLRNMVEAGVSGTLIRESIVKRKGAHRVLPFRYVAAARACPQMEPVIDIAFQEAIGEMPDISGETIVLVDVSGSMDSPLSTRSDMTRIDAAAALGAIFPGMKRVFTFSNEVVEVPPRRGMAGIDAIQNSQTHWGTWLGKAIQTVNSIPHDRLVVISDEQSHDRVPDPVAKNAYMINVASNRNGVGYGRWTHIDGFSENVIRFILEKELQ